MRGVGPIVALELGYALQCRQEARGAAIIPLIFGQVSRCCAIGRSTRC
jgi:hypothetical protein